MELDDASDMISPIDMDKAAGLAFQVWTYKQGEMVSLMIHLGDRLGLYKELTDRGEVTAEELAEQTGMSARWLHEWLLSQAASGIIDTENGESFTMSPESSAVMADDEGSLLFAAGAFAGPIPPDTVDSLANAFETGIGLTYEQLGPIAAHTTDRMLGPWSRLALVPELIPRIAGLQQRLGAGARVADVGCGTGTALFALATAFPQSTFVGYDPSRHAVDLANERMQERDLTNVSVLCEGFEGLPAEPTYDLILSFDCLHDMTKPKEATHAIRGALKDDGIWMVKEIRAGATWAENQGNPMLAMMYATSVATCMSSALSEEGGAGLGTLGLHPELLEEMSRTAGFNSIEKHDIGDPANMYYEIRP